MSQFHRERNKSDWVAHTDFAGFTLVPNAVLRNPELKAIDVRVLALIHSTAHLNGWVTVFARLRKEANVGQYAFDSSIKRLKKAGYLKHYQLINKVTRRIVSAFLATTWIPGEFDEETMRQQKKVPRGLEIYGFSARGTNKTHNPINPSMGNPVPLEGEIGGEGVEKLDGESHGPSKKGPQLRKPVSTNTYKALNNNIEKRVLCQKKQIENQTRQRTSPSGSVLYAEPDGSAYATRNSLYGGTGTTEKKMVRLKYPLKEPKKRRGASLKNSSQTIIGKRKKVLPAKKLTKLEEKADKVSPEIKRFVTRFLEARKKSKPQYYTRPIFKRMVAESTLEIERLCRLDKFSLEDDIAPVLKWAVEDAYWNDKLYTLGGLRRKIGEGFSKFVYLHQQYSSWKKKQSLKNGRTPSPGKKVVCVSVKVKKAVQSVNTTFGGYFNSGVEKNKLIQSLNETFQWYQKFLAARAARRAGAEFNALDTYQQKTDMLVNFNTLIDRFNEEIGSWASPAAGMYRYDHPMFVKFLKSRMNKSYGFDMFAGVKEFRP